MQDRFWTAGRPRGEEDQTTVFLTAEALDQVVFPRMASPGHSQLVNHDIDAGRLKKALVLL